MRFVKPIVGLILVLAAGASAQPLPNLVFTLGTTIQDSGQQNWSYVVLGSPQAALLAGRRLAVYGKTGLPADPGSFSLRGTLFQQTDAAAVGTLLNQSVSLGEDLGVLSDLLDTAFQTVPGIGAMPLAQKVIAAFHVAASDPGSMSELMILAHLHPGLNLCSGQAFAEAINAVTTYEVREVDPASGAAGDVIGRVTITPGAPVVLPAPGFPFQVVTNAPSDHLRIRLRWGTPDELRRLSLLQFGFNVWRIALADAQAGHYDVTPPAPADLSKPAFKRVNSFPVVATTDYAPLPGPGGPDDPTDRTTYFFSDSNGHSPGSAHFPPGQVPPGYLAPPFNDGDQFYYFITARDILGRDGLVSPGGLATASRKMPPPAPAKLSVLNTVQAAQPRLLVRWAQDTNINDMVAEYWVYRWPNPSMALVNDATPSNYVAGIAPQVAQTNFGFLLDTALGGPGPSNYWYTVRAVSQSAGGLLFSPNSAPASAVLRQRDAPRATTGQLVGSCGTPIAAFAQHDSLANTNGADTNSWHYRVTVTRRDAGVAWVQLSVGNTNFTQTMQSFGPLYFPPDGNSLSVDVPFPKQAAFYSEFDVSCVAGNYYGQASPPAFYQTKSSPPDGQITEAVFQAGELLLTALNSSDPLLQAANGAAACFPPTNPTRDESGAVHMLFPEAAGQAVLIQYSTNNGLSWVDLGAATPDTNGVYSIYLCPCVIAALPPLQGCILNLPLEGSCDQHVARAGDGGPIAPIHVRFQLTPGTREYRVYRSAEGAGQTMIAQGRALYDEANPYNELVVTDDAMPPGAARLCYFVQLLDENGHGSPLALIGCKNSVPPKPPRPTLSEPRAIGDTSHPQVALTWFCPTAGVYRFEVRIHQDPPQSGLIARSQLTSLALFALPTPNPNTRFFGLRTDSAVASLFEDWRVTPPAGPGFGPGPQFSITADVVPNATYHISVAAEDAHGDWGDASTEWVFTWKPPPANLTVPWPARPLPPVTLFDDPSAVPGAGSAVPSPRVAAVLLAYVNPRTRVPYLDPNYPVGIRFARLYGTFTQTNNIAVTNFAGYAGPTDPNVFVFKRYSQSSDQNGQPLLPIVVYRQQATNANFPRVSGNVTQVTPLLERVPWINSNGDATVIPDRLIALGSESSVYPPASFLYLRDQQPVILGARYHYYAARLNDQREVSEIIDAGTVDIPTTP
jgi:hypothetical protein